MATAFPAISPSLFGGDPFRLDAANRTFSQSQRQHLFTVFPAGSCLSRAAIAGTEGRDAEYSFGPSVRWDLLRSGPMRLSANSSLAFTDRGQAGFAGLSFSVVGARTSLSADAGYRSSDFSDDVGRRAGAVGAIRGTWRQDDFAGGEMTLGAGYDRDLDRDLIDGQAEFRGRQANLNAELIHELGAASGATQYSLGFDTTLALRGGDFAFEGRDRSDSMVMVKAGDGTGDGMFDVLVNDGVVGTVRIGKTVAVPLPPYRQYEVRVRQSAGDLLHYDGASRKVALYPGTVARLEWQARPAVSMFGQIVAADGTPLSNITVTGAGSISETDDNGFFQIEAPARATLSAALPDGEKCEIQLPDPVDEGGYARLGPLICGGAQQTGRRAFAAARIEYQPVE